MTEERTPYTLPPTYCYSLSEDGTFTGQYKSIEDARGAAHDELATEVDVGTTRTVYVGRCQPAAELVTAGRLGTWSIDHLLENIEDSLHDQIGWDDQIMEVSEEAKNDLAKLIETFLAERATFKAYGVADVQPHQITVED